MTLYATVLTLLSAAAVTMASEKTTATGAVPGPGALTLVEAPLPPFPAEMKARTVVDGLAVVGCLIAPDGAVREAWALKASDRAFAKAAEEAVSRWRYAPAPADASGVPAVAPRLDVVQIHFATTGALISRTQYDATKAAFPEDANRLPRIVENLPSAAPRPARLEGRMPSAQAGKPGGVVEVEFFIDSEGRVRLPVARRATHPALAEAAVAAVRQWRFEGPRVDGDPVTLQTRWTFKFPERAS